jgi:hypothetical protein
LISGIGAVAGARLAYAAIADRLSSPVAPQASVEPAARPPVVAQPVTVESAPNESCPTLEAEPYEFNPTGTYVLNQETIPKAFADIDYLELETREYIEEGDEYVARSIIPRGSIFAGKRFRLTRISVGGYELAFQTETVDGVSYRFVGRFTSEEEYEAGDPDIKGNLIKIKDGKWAAEIQAEFYIDGC